MTSQSIKLSIPAFTVAALCVSLSSCVSYYELPEAYNGPVATIRSTSNSKNTVSIESFEVSQINGVLVQGGTQGTAYGAGMAASTKEHSVDLPANQPVTVQLTGRDSFAADGAALFSALSGGTSKTVTGEFQFTPKAQTYTVTGQLGKEASTVWLEDARGRKVSPVFSSQ